MPYAAAMAHLLRNKGKRTAEQFKSGKTHARLKETAKDLGSTILKIASQIDKPAPRRAGDAC